MAIKTPHEIISTPTKISKLIISLSVVFTIIYFMWWLDFRNMGNPYLYIALFIGEIYHVLLSFGYAYAIWDQKKPRTKKLKAFPKVDIFITVCGEPEEVVEKTVKAALAINYPNHEVFILNDGYVYEKSKGKRTNWREINALAKKYGVTAITRRKPGGAKAGNVNNAIKLTDAPFFVVLDADHIPYENFLQKTMGYFNDDKMAIVQTPQYYENSDDSFLTQAAWEQQELFFGPICRGKIRMNATFWCGTNAVIRREALVQVGGVPEDNIAEDFLASLFIHKNGWHTTYVPEVLARGLAPHDLESYINQQYRWARGSLEVIFKYNPLFIKGLTWAQKAQYLWSAGYFLNGFVIVLNAFTPILVLATGITPVNINSTNFMIFFFPYIFSTLYLLMLSTHNTITFKAIQMSMSSFYIFITAAFSTIFGFKATFKVTSKSAKDEGNYLKYTIPHFTYIILGIGAAYLAIIREGLVPSVVTNISWVLFNFAFFFGFIRVAYPWRNLLTNSINYINKFSLSSNNVATTNTPALAKVQSSNKVVEETV